MVARRSAQADSSTVKNCLIYASLKTLVSSNVPMASRRSPVAWQSGDGETSVRRFRLLGSQSASSKRPCPRVPFPYVSPVSPRAGGPQVLVEISMPIVLERSGSSRTRPGSCRRSARGYPAGVPGTLVQDDRRNEPRDCGEPDGREDGVPADDAEVVPSAATALYLDPDAAEACRRGARDHEGHLDRAPLVVDLTDQSRQPKIQRELLILAWARTSRSSRRSRPSPVRRLQSCLWRGRQTTRRRCHPTGIDREDVCLRVDPFHLLRGRLHLGLADLVDEHRLSRDVSLHPRGHHRAGPTARPPRASASRLKPRAACADRDHPREAMTSRL